MTDFRDLLDHASRPEQDWLADSHALLGEGRRRVRRRRARAGALGCAVALAVAGVGLGLGRGHLGPDRPQVATPTTYADLDLTPLSSAEVQARCQAQLADHTNGEVTSFLVPDDLPAGSPVQQPPHPWHAGLTVYGIPASHPDSTDDTACTIPDSGATPVPLELTTQPDRLRRICGDNLRTDLTGWQQLAVAADGGVEVGLFRSGNGYLADCSAQSSPKLGVQGDTGLLKEGRWYGYAVCTPTTRPGIHCLGVGRVDDRAATAVDVTLPSGRVVRTDAVDGYWAVAVRDDGSPVGSGSEGEGSTFPARPVP